MNTSHNIPAENLQPGPWWHHAKKNGYTTMYGANSITWGMSFGKKGFFDFSTSSIAADIVLREGIWYNSGFYGYRPYSPEYEGHCLSGQPGPQYLFDQISAMSQASSEAGDAPFAVQIVNNDLHNGNLLNARMVDASLVRMLEQLEQHGRAHDTIVLIYADHGARYGAGAQSTGTLRHVYNSNPMFRLLIPPSLAQQVGDVLSMNENVLTQPLDVYSTLRHIIEMEVKKSGRTTTFTSSYTTDPSGMWGQQGVAGLSVFQPLPTNRTCADGGIPLHRCTCMFGLRTIVFDLNVNDAKKIPTEYQSVYPHVVATAIGQLFHVGGGGKIFGCRKPHLHEVISFEVQRAPSGYSKEVMYYFYLRFSIVEDPEAVFKATVPVRKKVRMSKKSGVVSESGGRYMLASNLVGARAIGYTKGHKGNYLIAVDRITPMQKSCSKIVLEAPTQELRQISEPHCVC